MIPFIGNVQNGQIRRESDLGWRIGEGLCEIAGGCKVLLQGDDLFWSHKVATLTQPLNVLITTELCVLHPWFCGKKSACQ